MTAKKTTQYIPLIYSYIYMKIKKKMRGNRISGSNLRKIIQKIILCDKDGGNKGIPRRYRYDIINDLIELNLIEKVGMIHKDNIYQDNCEKISEVAERLNDWNISDKLREDKEVNDKLSIALNILDKDALYKVVKSQSNKQIKQAFW